MRVLGILTDADGTPLAWVMASDGRDDIRDEEGRSALRPVPPEIAAAAWAYLEDARSGDLDR